MVIGIGLALGLAGVAGAGASIFGATEQANASSNAISAQQQEQRQGQQFLTNMFNTGANIQSGYLGQGVNALAPYAAAGTTPLSWYNYMTGTGPLPGSSTMPTSFSPGQPGQPASGGTTAGQPSPFGFGSLGGPSSAPSGGGTLGQEVDAQGNPLSGKAGSIAQALQIPGGWSADYDQNLANKLLSLPAGTDVSQWLQSQGVYSNLIPGITSQLQGFSPAPPAAAAPAAPPAPQFDANGNPLPQSFNPTTAPLTAPFNAASLAGTPGYQFALSQGEMANNNANAATGWGGSGPAAKALTGYASGQAQQVYNSQFANYLAQNAQVANLLLAPAQLGAGAAGNIGGLFGNAGNAAIGAATGTGISGNQGAVTTGQGIATSTAGIGNAIAGGAVGATNSLSNALLQYNLLNAFKGGTQGGGAVSPISYNTGAFGSANGGNVFGANPAGYAPVDYTYGSNLFGGGY